MNECKYCGGHDCPECDAMKDNIEETNTREIAGRVDDFYLQFCHEVNGKIKFDFDDAEIAIKWVKNNLEEMQATHHQQLQKAREEERKRWLDKLAEAEEKIEWLSNKYGSEL